MYSQWIKRDDHVFLSNYHLVQPCSCNNSWFIHFPECQSRWWEIIHQVDFCGSPFLVLLVALLCTHTIVKDEKKWKSASISTAISNAIFLFQNKQIVVLLSHRTLRQKVKIIKSYQKEGNESKILKQFPHKSLVAICLSGVKKDSIDLSIILGAQRCSSWIS